jgi:hypothetical protein
MTEAADWPPDPPEYRTCRTYILDENDNHVARLDVAVWPPVGSVIELGNPNRDAVVLDVRLQLPLGPPPVGDAVIIVSTDDSGSEGTVIPRNAAERFLGPGSPP